MKFLKPAVLTFLFGIIFSAASFPQDVFAPGIISIQGQHDDYISFSPDETFLTFTRFTDDYRHGTIYFSEKRNGEWQQPEVAPFSGTYNDSRSFISPDGNRIYFVSNRPTPELPDKRDLDIWYVEMENDGWGEPVNAGNVINTELNDSHPSVAENGNLYFIRWGRGIRNDIFISEFKNGSFQAPKTHPSVNTEQHSESHPFIDPKEGFMLFGSARDPEGMDGEVYITLQKNGQWSDPVKLNLINSSLYEYSAKIAPAQNRIYFSRTDFREGGEKADIYYRHINLKEMLKELESQVNFSDN